MYRAMSASVVAAVLAATLSVAASPAQAAPTISVISARLAPGSADLAVTVDDPNNQSLTSMTVHIDQGPTDVLDVTDMTLTDGANAADQTWTSAAPLALAAGTYTMTIDATDSMETDTGLAGGTLPFIYTGTQITAAANPSSINFEGQTTVSGTLTGFLPGASTATGVSGIPVFLLDNLTNIQRQIATTNSQGAYKATIHGTSGNYVQTSTNSVAQGAEVGELNIGYTSNYPTRISATVKPQDFKYGNVGQATMTGTAQYKAGSSWRPFADAVVFATGGMSSGYVPTDSNGRFTWNFVPTLIDNGTGWQALTDAPGVMQSQVYGNVHISVPLRFLGFSASLDPFAILHVHGCAETTVPDAQQPGAWMVIQYAAKSAGPWYRLGRVRMNGGTTTCVNAGYFAGSLPVRLASAYYRASFPATPDFQHAVSKAKHLSKYLTRIVSLKVSPRSVSHGGDITVKGRLEWHGRAWRGYAKRQILIILRPKGSKHWYWIHKVNTNARGSFSKTFMDPVTADWSAVYEGDKTHFACGGTIHHVTVTGALAASQVGQFLHLMQSPVLGRLGVVR